MSCCLVGSSSIPGPCGIALLCKPLRREHPPRTHSCILVPGSPTQHAALPEGKSVGVCPLGHGILFLSSPVCLQEPDSTQCFYTSLCFKSCSESLLYFIDLTFLLTTFDPCPLLNHLALNSIFLCHPRTYEPFCIH